MHIDKKNKKLFHFIKKFGYIIVCSVITLIFDTDSWNDDTFKKL
jgi:hypothetical protein